VVCKYKEDSRTTFGEKRGEEDTLALPNDRISIIKDEVGDVFKALKKMTGKHVLVGVPEETASRPEDEINNAAIAYIHEFGSPNANIPARPFLLPGVKSALPEATSQLKLAAIAASNGNQKKADAYLASAGQIAVNIVKRTFMAGEGWPPLKPETVARRYKERGDLKPRPGELQYLELIGQGASAEQAQQATGIHPLPNTGELLRSITYVVREVKDAPT
jgi:hypothetical protein